MSLLARLATVALVICLAFSLDLHAQRKVVFGADASLDLNGLGGQQSLGGTSHLRPGFSVHGHSHFRLGQHISFDAGLGYSFKTNAVRWNDIVFSNDISPTGVVTHSNMRMDYHYHQLQAPLLIKCHLGSFEKGVYLGAGPMLGYSFGFNSKGVIHHSDGRTETFSTGTISGSNSIAIALQGCAGYRFDLGDKVDLGLELYGSTDVGQQRLAPVRPYAGGFRVQTWF